MRALLHVAILLLLFFQAGGQSKFSKKELIQDLSVLRDIAIRTNPQMTDARRAQMRSVFSEAARSFSLDDATGLEFIQYIHGLEVKTGYDGHASFSLHEQLFPASPVFFPVPVYLLGDRLVVNSEKAALPYGSIIQTINNVSTDSILKRLAPGDREVDFIKHRLGSIFHAAYFLGFGGADDFVIKYHENINSAEVKTVTCKAVSLKDAFASQQSAVFPLMKITAQNVNQVHWVFDDVEKTFYLQLRSFSVPPHDSSKLLRPVFDSLFKFIRDKGTRSLVLDIRGNGGGMMQVPGLLLSYLVDAPFDEVHHWKMVPVKDIPLDYLKRIDQRPVATKSDGRKMLYRLYDGAVTQNNITYKNDHFKRQTSQYRFSGPVILLTDGGTFSAAAYFAGLFQQSRRGTVMGLPTGGAARQMTAGHMLEYELPNTKIVVSLPLMYITFGDTGSVNTGRDYVMPDVKLSFELQYEDFYKKQDWGTEVKGNFQ